MTTTSRRLTARNIHIGDKVEMMTGAYAGTKGVVKAKRPMFAPFASFILVDVEMPKKIDSVRYSMMWERFKVWQVAANWKVLENE